MKKTIGYSLIYCVIGFSSITAINGCSASTTAAVTQHPLQNEAITRNIKTAFARNPLLAKEMISVSTSNQTIYLKGVLETTVQRDRAIMLAKNIASVRAVDASALRLEASQSAVKDKAITDKVKTFLAAQIVENKNLNAGSLVSVETHNGDVFLTGKIASKKHKLALLSHVNSMLGVKHVYNDIIVENKAHHIGRH